MTALLLSFLLRAMILGALGLIALRLLRRQSASTRHAVAVVSIAAMIALPLLAYLLPTRTVSLAGAPDALRYLSQTRIESVANPASAPKATTSFEWLPLLWVAAALIYWLRFGVGIMLMCRHIWKGRELPLGRLVQVVEDGGAKVPMVVWMGRSRVLLPKTWSSWPKERLEHVLAHEEAHVRRGDWFSQVFVHVATIAMWPNPFAHLLAKHARDLAEQAADDLVISAGADPSGYASALLEIARGAATTPTFAIPMAAKVDVARRIEMILNKNARRGSVSVGTLVMSALLLFVVAVPVACWAIQGKPTNVVARQAPHFGMTTPLMILDQKDVQSDLAMNGEQVKAVQRAVNGMREDLRAGAKAEEAVSTCLSKMEAILTPSEKTRLFQIFVQWRQSDSVLEPSVQQELGITPDQKARIQRIAAEFQKSNADLWSKNLSSERAQAIQKKLNDDYSTSLSGVLTQAQAAKLHSMGGAPFNGQIQGTIWSQGV